MITLTPKALHLIERYRAAQPRLDFCVHVSWREGAADNWRSPDGEDVWACGIPEGWVVDIVPFLEEIHGAIPCSVVSGTRVLLESNGPPGFPFQGSVIDARGIDLCIAS
jgi:hypothetical protein